MDRRDVLRVAGAVAVPGLAGLDPERLFALARDAHALSPRRGEPRTRWT